MKPAINEMRWPMHHRQDHCPLPTIYLRKGSLLVLSSVWLTQTGGKYLNLNKRKGTLCALALEFSSLEKNFLPVFSVLSERTIMVCQM
jgi:hypothetical protein